MPPADASAISNTIRDGTFFQSKPSCPPVSFATQRNHNRLKSPTFFFSQSLTGHAFLIIGLNTANGIEEEMFGFYPVAAGGKGVVKGPGMLKAEYRCGPNDDCGPQHREELLLRLSEVKESVTVH